jgi:hypothetical protein
MASSSFKGNNCSFVFSGGRVRQVRKRASPLVLVIMLLLGGGSSVEGGAPPDADRGDICVGVATVTTVATLIQVPPGREFERFVNSLHVFSRMNNYFWGPVGSGVEANENGHIDIILVKIGTSEGIHISNRERPAEINATMSECGSERFRPYWEQFMKFAKQYAASRPNYPD